jgi:hypothetical protein
MDPNGVGCVALNRLTGWLVLPGSMLLLLLPLAVVVLEAGAGCWLLVVVSVDGLKGVNTGRVLVAGVDEEGVDFCSTLNRLASLIKKIKIVY